MMIVKYRMISVLAAVVLFSSAAFSQAAAKVLSEVAPVFPAEVRELDYGETVKVAVNVDKKGAVSNAYVYGPLTPCKNLSDPVAAAVRKAAYDAARKMVLEPVTKDGKAVETGLMITYRLRPKRPAPEPQVVKMIVAGGVNGKARHLEKPIYPRRAKEDRVGGTVTFDLLIGEDGSVISAGAATGHPYLIDGNLESACKSKFSPTLLEGKPVKVLGVITYNFIP
jgi:outer membrane biosynthesis protein TonB